MRYDPLMLLGLQKGILTADKNSAAQSDVFAYVRGRMFGKWMTAGRSTGFSEGSLIETPGYLIESLLRDECFVERDLELTGVTNSTTVTINNLKFLSTNYYADAILTNVTTGETFSITANDTGGVLTISPAATITQTTGDQCFVSNIQGTQKIDVTSFDLIGDGQTGSRKDWKFAKSFTQKIDVKEAIRVICYESFLMLNSVNGVYKLIALDTGTQVTTLTRPLKDTVELVSHVLSPIENVFTDFRIYFGYDNARGDYRRELFCNKDGSSPEIDSGMAAYKGKCQDAETNYRIKRKFEYSCQFINDDATALLFFKKLITWLTFQKLLVSWTSSFSDSCFSSSGNKMLDIGDLALLNYAKIIPVGKNNSTVFLVTGKNINTMKGSPSINFQLIGTV